VSLTIGGQNWGRAGGRSKKEAEQSAAAAALEAIEAQGNRER
jgi:dsRNA-specific ribonuclease